MTGVAAQSNVEFGSRPRPKRGSFYIHTWGCQMNEEDSEQLAIRLAEIGFSPADSIWEASVILLNTCSVRKKPEDKAFSLMGELAPLKKRNPEVVLGVCGCMAQVRAEEIRRRAPHVDFVLGTGDLGHLPALVEQTIQSRKFRTRLDLPPRKGHIVDQVPGRAITGRPKLKAFVPVQYGCDKFCSFCIVPMTRGRERSRPAEEIVNEVEALVAGGTREVTLLGQTVNSYGRNLASGKMLFSQLLWRLAEIDGLQRIRYTSPYPRDFKPDLIKAIRDCPKVMEHCHLPVQSGDNEVLRQMRRQYTVESFCGVVDELRKQIPGLSLTTDVIVGFPGETEEQFERTLDLMRRIRFDGAFMFAYSPRPGTDAGDRADQVAEAVKKERLNRLIALQNDITCEINGALIGRELEVFVEGPSAKNPAMLQGYSRGFRMVHFPGSRSRTGRLAKVRATGAHLWGLSGEAA